MSSVVARQRSTTLLSDMSRRICGTPVALSEQPRRHEALHANCLDTGNGNGDVSSIPVLRLLTTPRQLVVHLVMDQKGLLDGGRPRPWCPSRFLLGIIVATGVTLAFIGISVHLIERKQAYRLKSACLNNTCQFSDPASPSGLRCSSAADCSSAAPAVRVHPASNRPACLNGGRYRFQQGSLGPPVCICPAGFTGAQCELQAGCTYVGCANGSVCIQNECVCPPNRVGPECEHRLPEVAEVSLVGDAENDKVPLWQLAAIGGWAVIESSACVLLSKLGNKTLLVYSLKDEKTSSSWEKYAWLMQYHLDRWRTEPNSEWNLVMHLETMRNITERVELNDNPTNTSTYFFVPRGTSPSIFSELLSSGKVHWHNGTSCPEYWSS